MPNNIYQPQPREFYVYVYLDPRKDNQPFYVGKGKDDRAFHHVNGSSNAGKNLYKSRILAKIREADLRPMIVCAWHGSDEQYAFRVERLLIAMWGRYCDGGVLTNLAMGGEGKSGMKPWNKGKTGQPAWNKGIPMRTEIKQKLAHTFFKVGQQAWNKGKPMSEEQRKKNSEAQTGVIRGPYPPFTEEHRRKLSEAKKGKCLSEETRKKMSEAQIARHRPKL